MRGAIKLKIAVCEDEREQRQAICSLAAGWGKKTGRACEIYPFHSAEALSFACAGDETFDILLLDVELGGMSGIELAKRLRWGGCRAQMIFITSHFEFCGEGYEVDALHYLMKPLSEKRLGQALEKAAQRLAEEPPSLIIACGGETLRLFEADILYIEAALHYIDICSSNGTYRLKENISAFSERLSSDFYQTHRSYLVSLRHIIRISRSAVWLDNGVRLPLARGKYEDINRAFIARN